MKLPQFKNRKWSCLPLAFLVPVVSILVMLMIRGSSPFGNSSLLYSDTYHQYYPFFVSFRRALLSGDSLLYNWDVGLGMDYLGLASYYLASPLNLLSILIPEGWLLGYFSLLMPIKLGFASLFFAIFLKKLFGKDDFSIVMFGSFYGLCAWALGYQWNIMWLDTFAMLPLVALGTVCLLRDKKFLLYTLSLASSIAANYYIGFFVCIFVALVFMCYEICRFRGIKDFLLDLIRIAVFSALAIGLTAFLELPAFATLQTTYSSVNQFPEGFQLNIAKENTWGALFDAMRQVAGNVGGGLVTTFKEGLPNLYCGVATVLFSFLYLVAKDIKLRDKICAVCLLLFFNISFIVRQLDYIWHGFHFTNMIPYRFSFLYSFVLLYMAYRAWLLRENFKVWHILTATALAVGLFACSDFRFDSAFLAYNLGYLILIVGALIYSQYTVTLPRKADKRLVKRVQDNQKRRRANATLLMLVFMASELVINFVNFSVNFPGTDVTNYPRDTKYAASMIRYMHEREDDTLFYRAETAHSQTLNDGALNGYSGISTFTSSANVKVTNFMRVLGYAAKNDYNRYCYEEASPVSNLFLGVKYMIEREGRDKQSTYFEDLHHYGFTHLLENKAYLPLGFLTESSLADVIFAGNTNIFRFQNDLFSAATGREDDVWRLLTGEELTITGKDATITNQNSTGYCSYRSQRANSSVTYSYEVTQAGFMCVNLNLPKRNRVYISVNGVELYSEAISLPQMLAVGDVDVGDVVNVRAVCKANETGTMTLSAAILDEDRFAKGYDVLSASTLELTDFSNTRIEGTIDCNRDGLLYTSIPQNGNWHVLVDGKEAPIKLVGDAMVAVELTEGFHQVTFIYRNGAFIVGLMISLICAAILIAIYLVVNKKVKLPIRFKK